MIDKIDFLKIVRQHFRTLHHYGRPGISYTDIFIFYVVPMVISGSVVFGLNHRIGDKSTDFLAAVFSIFIGLLLNLLVLIFDNTKKCDEKEKHRLVLQETFANISYSILISVSVVALLMLSKLGFFLGAISFVVVTLIGNFFLTLLMILKRVHTLVWEETK